MSLNMHSLPLDNQWTEGEPSASEPAPPEESDGLKAREGVSHEPYQRLETGKQRLDPEDTKKREDKYQRLRRLRAQARENCE
jgi:hypothetical protein